MDDFLLGISLIVILSIVARLIAVYIRVPAIVPLLIIGILAGVSVTDLIDPAKLLGDSLSPIVQIAVGIILFEGALSLKRRRQRRFDHLHAGPDQKELRRQKVWRTRAEAFLFGLMNDDDADAAH